RNEKRGRTAEKHRPVDRHRPMVEIGPETLAQAESLDLPVTELEELRLFPCALAPKFWQCLTASFLRSFPRKRESSRRHYSRARPGCTPVLAGTSGDTVRIEATATPLLSAQPRAGRTPGAHCLRKSWRGPHRSSAARGRCSVWYRRN